MCRGEMQLGDVSDGNDKISEYFSDIYLFMCPVVLYFKKYIYIYITKNVIKTELLLSVNLNFNTENTYLN